jgi:salicylate hydroxylase
MSRSRPQRIVIAGAGIAGALLVAMLRRSAAREILCFEQTEAGAQEGIGTGLNIGPNAVKTLRAFAPALAAALEAHALPWREWRIALTDGRELARIDLRDVADNPGLRLRWSELYRLLRAPIAEQVRFGEAVVGFRYAADGEEGPLVVTVENRLDGARRFIGGVDLLIGADGRFSQVRGAFEAPSPPRHLGIANFRLLIPHGPDGLIDDYVQYYNGPNRLLAFRVPGDAIYLSATLPVQPGARLAADRRTPVALQTPYRPSSGALAPACAFLLEAVERLHADIHWSRFSERDICFTVRAPPRPSRTPASRRPPSTTLPNRTPQLRPFASDAWHASLTSRRCRGRRARRCFPVPIRLRRRATYRGRTFWRPWRSFIAIRRCRRLSRP